jgi:outer membrane lipoprotein-sorting protein
LLIATTVLVLSTCVRADEAAEKQGAALMDKYVEATGGQAAYDAIKSRVVKAEASMPGGGMTGTMEVYAIYPDKFRAEIEMPGGKFERGSNGETVWVSHPSFGAQILEGADRVSAIRESTQDRFGQWRKIFKKAEYIGDEEVDGTACSKVLLTYKAIDPEVEESPVTAFVAKDSGLILKWTTTMNTPQGDADVAVRLSDYRKVGDVTVPHQMNAEAIGFEQKVKIEEMKLNVDIPAARFALPEAIEAQLNVK